MNIQRKNFIINSLYYAIALLIIYFIIKYALPYFAPFILAYAISASLQKVANRLSQKYKIKPRLSGILSTIIAWLLLFLIAGAIIYILFIQAQNFLSNTTSFSDLIEQLSNSLSNLFYKINSLIPGSSSEIIKETVSEAPKTILSFITTISNKIISFITEVFKITPTVIIFILVSFLSSVFISADYEKIKNFIIKQIPYKYHSKCKTARDFFLGTAIKLIKAYLIIMLITCIELIIGLSIAGIKYAIFLSVIIAVFDILPYVGCGTILLPWSIIELISKNYRAGITIILLTAVITLVRNLVEPKIIGKETNTHPLLVLIAVYLGGKLFGFLGIILCPVLVIFLVKLYNTGYIKLNNEKKETA